VAAGHRVGGSAPLTPHLPLWLAWHGNAFAWRAALTWRQWHLPPRWLLVILVMAGTVGVFLQYRTILGRTPGVALLVVFLALKLLELRAARDAVATALLCYFLVLGQFLFTQTIPTAMLACITILITTATLLAASDDRPNPRQQLRRAGLMLAQALPFMLLLFVLFPRVQGPLWGIPQDRFSAVSGLSDTMSPGSIAQLSQSDAIAFRVRFKGEVPPQSQLYWRGRSCLPSTAAVGAWRKFWAPTHRFRTPPPAHRWITKSPWNRTENIWLFALEMPGTLPPESALTSDYQPVARQAVRNRIRYTQRAWPDAIAGGQRSAEACCAMRWRCRKTAIRAFVPSARPGEHTWRRRRGDPRSPPNLFLKQLLIYTLNPPLLGPDIVDEFLFDTKRGFCEHFAASFVFALRAAGVPARVVAGYQGGEVNPVDGYLVVRQYDAHAWAEAWIAGAAGCVSIRRRFRRRAASTATSRPQCRLAKPCLSSPVATWPGSGNCATGWMRSPTAGTSGCWATTRNGSATCSPAWGSTSRTGAT
jgi:transglutaminase-like putative cysteine protease